MGTFYGPLVGNSSYRFLAANAAQEMTVSFRPSLYL
jgi:hypothetical protein